MTYEQIQQRGYDLTFSEYQDYIDEILKDYKTGFNNINDEIRKLYTDILDGIEPEEYFNYMTKFQRLERLQKSIADEYRKTALAAGRTQGVASTLAMNNNYYRQLYDVNWSESANGIFAFINPKAVELSVFGTQKLWAELSKANKDKWRNLVPRAGSLSERLAKHRTADLRAIREALTSAMINGEGFRKTSAKLRKIMNTSANNALRIARTEGIRNANNGDLENAQYARSKGVEIERQWDATLDLRTRPTHSAADGQTEDKNGLFRVGDAVGHGPGSMSTASESINCRCTTYKKTEGMERGTRRGLDPLTGKSDLITYKTYEQWANTNGLVKDKNGIWVPKKK